MHHWSGLRQGGGRAVRISLVFVALAVGGFAGAGCGEFADRPEIAPSRAAAAGPDRYWEAPSPEAARDAALVADYRSTATVSGRTSLAELIDIALRNNPDTRRSWEAARAAAAAYGQAQAAYYPKVAFANTAGYTRFPFQTDPGPSIVRQWQTLPTFEATYTLIDFGRRAADSTIAEEESAAANFAMNRTIQTVVFAVQRGYYGLAAAEAAVAAAQQNVALAASDLESVDKRVNLGLATRPALLLARERRAQAEYELENARTMVNDARAALATAAGIAADRPFEIADLSHEALPTTLGAEVDDLIRQALGQRPDLAAAAARLHEAEAAEQRSHAEWYPTVGIDSRWGEDYWQYNFNGSPTITSGAPDAAALVTLRWDIFTGFYRLNDDRRAAAERAAQGEAVRALELATIAQVWSSYYDFQDGLKRNGYAQALLAAARASYADNALTYRRGLSTIVELLTAQRDLADARYTVIQARAELLSEAAAVVYAVGGLRLPGASH